MSEARAGDLLGTGASVTRPCGRCGQPAEFSAAGLSAVKGFNAQLAKRREPPITAADVVRCPACADSDRYERVREMEESRARCAAVIARLRVGIEVQPEEMLAVRQSPHAHLLRDAVERMASDKPSVSGRAGRDE